MKRTECQSGIMYEKIYFILLMRVLSVTGCLSRVDSTDPEDIPWDGFSAKWAMDPKEGFYELPRTANEARNMNYSHVSGTELPDQVETLGWSGDPRVVLIFMKDTGKVIGIMISFSVADMEKLSVPIDYSKNPALTLRKLSGRWFYTGLAFFHQEETKGIRKIWINEKNGLVEIPTEARSATLSTSHSLKGCFTWMGSHYYRMNSTTDCGNIYPWGFLKHGGHIVGLSFQVIGKVRSGTAGSWYETLPPNFVKTVISDAPTCFVKETAKYGITSLHVYFKNYPRSIYCCNEELPDSPPRY